MDFQVQPRDLGNKQILTHTKRADNFIQDMITGRTASQFKVVSEDAAPDDLDANPQLVWPLVPPPSQEQLIINH